MIGSDFFHEVTSGARLLMPAERVPLNEFCAGRLALDFCNTLTPDRSGNDNDRLSGLDGLLAWVGRSGWLAGKSAGGKIGLDQVTASDLQAFRSLRQRLSNLFGAVIDGRAADPVDVDALDGAVLDAFSSLRLSAGPVGQPLRWQETAGPLDKLRHAIARDAADLLTSGDLHRLKRCPGEMCGWLFYDGSKNGTRRWCVMEDCGTRAKVKRFRDKQRAEADF